ncbi:unnamed protein product [Rhizoctonia solani]|uniref:Uncharacterized protein n=1 Tax=Rhizoctonia solani TaxID=456999 RepID=A0A8H3E3J1_9AGAM|nr:unnamed protein product [Rhizoctonia solani]CAE7154875.1 unnamed protein product [Rhizoctonia solani]
MSSNTLPPGSYLIRAVSKKDPNSDLFAIHQGPGNQVEVAPKGSGPQVWDVTPSPEEGGYNIRPSELHNLDSAYLRNINNGTVILAERQFLRVNPKDDYYSIWGPYRAGTYGAPDWIGVVDNKLVQRTQHDPPPSLDSYLWEFIPA